MTKIAEIEPINENKGVFKIKFKGINKEKKEKRAAPDDVPIKYGSKSGFLKSVCSKRPERERDEPANIAVKALGILKFRIISLSKPAGPIKIEIIKIRERKNKNFLTLSPSIL